MVAPCPIRIGARGNLGTLPSCMRIALCQLGVSFSASRSDPRLFEKSEVWVTLRSLPYRRQRGWELLRSQRNDVCGGPCCMYGASGCRPVRHLPCGIEMESMLVDYLHLGGPGDPGDMGWCRQLVCMMCCVLVHSPSWPL